MYSCVHEQVSQSRGPLFLSCPRDLWGPEEAQVDTGMCRWVEVLQAPETLTQ